MLRLPIRYFQTAVSLRLFGLLNRSLSSKTMAPTPWTPNTYPPARRSDHIDSYKSAANGEVRVADPYQWMEQDNDEIDKWTSAQERFTRNYLDKNPERQRLEDAFQASMNYARFSPPELEEDGHWYWFLNTGLQPQPVMYRSKERTLPDFSQGDHAVGEVFFDANLLADDGTSSLSIYTVSECGKYFAYGISESGSDYSTIYVRRTDCPLSEATGKRHGPDDGRMPDEIKYVKFSSITWTKDSRGFFYQRFPSREDDKATPEGIDTDSNVDAMVYYHRIGTSQSEDILVHRDTDNPTWLFSVSVTEDGKYLLLYTSKDTSRNNLLWVAEVEKNEIGPNIKWKKVRNEFIAEFHVVANDDSIFYVKTNLDAPQYKLITIDVEDDNRPAKDLIAEEKDATLVSINCVNTNNFAIVYKRNVMDELYVYSKSGERLERLAADFVGAASLVGREKQHHMLVTMIGFNSPATIGYYDFLAPEGQRWRIYRATKVQGINPNDFEAQQVWYESKDGTRVPMFIVRHKSTKFDGTAAAFQYGYGGFSIPVVPFFSPTILTFLQTYGALLAVPNIRGGSEFGEDWHKAAIREKKYKGFDDFIAATEYLVKHKYVAPGKVAINGGSNGGLLIGACINRAPEGTFGAAVAEVGVMDLLKFNKFTIGKAWTSDYGNPDDPNDFDFIYPISPLHNIPSDRVLPPTLLMTADHDDRVVPMHSFKHAATLQHSLSSNPHPLLLRVEKKSGHGAGKATDKWIHETADKLGFVAQSMGLVWRDLPSPRANGEL